MKFIARQDNHRHRRITKIVRQLKLEPIVVNENRIQIFIEQFLGHITFKLVESEIQELESRQLKDDHREFSGEPIVTQIELEQELEVLEFVRHSAAEPIGVDVEEGEICE